MRYRSPVPDDTQVSAARLRELLDTLRTALARTSQVSPSALPLRNEQTGLVAFLDTVLAALARHSAASVVQAPAAHPTLCGPLERTLAAWRAQVARALGPAKAAVVRDLLAAAAPNFMDILDVADDENRHSAVIRWLLDPRCAPSIAGPALSALVRPLAQVDRWVGELRAALAADSVSVRREYTIAYEWAPEQPLDRIDLVISSPRFVLAIENKVRAREHDEQTRRYWDWLSRLPILHAGLFLSPSGSPPASEAFTPMSYLELLSCLLEGPVQAHPTQAEHLVLSGYVKALAADILLSELRVAVEGGPNQ